MKISTSFAAMMVTLAAAAASTIQRVVAVQQALQVGDQICVEGFVMDTFCIERGTLLDNPSVATLEEPGEHSIHCLVDVNSCVSSPFEVLLDPTTAGQSYQRGWRLDDEAHAMAVQLAQSVGSCSTCTTKDAAENDRHQNGFRAVMLATITNLNTEDSSLPPIIAVEAMEDTTTYDAEASSCITYFGMDNIVDIAATVNDDETTSDMIGVDCDEAASSTERALAVGDSICTEGYVMDTFCIDRGTLFDNPTVMTLEDPSVHSIHCLVDVNSCVTSPYELLLDPTSPGQFYQRGWRLDAAGHDMAVNLAQTVGTCDTCLDDNSSLFTGGHQTGFRIAVQATITDLNSDDPSIPPTIQVRAMKDTTAFVGGPDDNGIDSSCMVYFGDEDIVDKALSPSSKSSSKPGCGDASSSSSSSSFLDGLIVDSNTANSQKQRRNKLMKMYLAHGSLMLVGWGLLLPAGAIIARFFKHRPHGLWFQLHRSIQMVGLLVTIIAWIIALTQFNVFGDTGLNSYRHGVLGMVVMILGILQPVNAIFRPRLPTAATGSKTTARIVWEYYHKGSGWLAVILAIPTIALGTLSLPSLDEQKQFQIAYGAGCGSILLFLIAYIFYDKKTFVVKNNAMTTKDASDDIDKDHHKSQQEQEQARSDTFP